MSSPVVLAGPATADWTGDAEFHEYTRAANPVGAHTPRLEVVAFPAALAEGRGTRLVELDQAAALRAAGPATTPALLAAWAVVDAGDALDVRDVATSALFFAARGAGSLRLTDGEAITWGAGDLVVVPGRRVEALVADEDALVLRVTDGPLVRYLGVAPTEDRFAPTRYAADRIEAELAAVAADPRATDRNRVAVLLGNRRVPLTLTATPTLWAMCGLLPVDAHQAPHRHQSVAVDVIVDCRPGCYSLVGGRLDDDGGIDAPTRVDWEPGGVFVTPPGLWHSHHNESGEPARLMPIQDAGLHTYLRSLDIRFSR